MSDKAWKQFERDAAALFNARRFPANQGGPLDFEGPEFAGQCKNVKVLSLARMEELAQAAEKDAAQSGKLGVLCLKRRAGSGRSTPTLITMTEEVWKKLYGKKK